MSEWTPEAIRALGVTTDLLTLGSILGVSRWKTYKMARANEWEGVGIRVVPIGAKYRVAVQSILEVLGYDEPAGTGNDDEPSIPVRETGAESAGNHHARQPSRPVAARGRP
jgi:hypothetical protein